MRVVVGLLAIALVAQSAAAQPSPDRDPTPATPTPTNPPTGPAPAPAPAPGQPAPPQPAPQQLPATPPPSGSGPVTWQGRPIERVQFRGNRKVEDDAIRVQLLSKPGTLLDAAKLREDIRAMWKMGFFADVSVEAEVGQSGGLTLTFAVKSEPSIRQGLLEASP